jgi:tetratricopeptide (TPR) repeat protein
MDRQLIEFGTEMRRRRLAAGHSLSTLAALVHYSRSHLSKVETGAKPPSSDLARRCDAALGGGGELSRLAPPPVASAAGPVEDGEVWIMMLDADGGNSFGPVSRRHLLAGGAAALGGWAATGPNLGPPQREAAPLVAAGPTVESYRAIFDHARLLGQSVPPAALVPMLAAQVHSLVAMAARGRAAERNALLALAATYAEYVGWLTQEAGDDARATWWTGRAVEYADSAGDPDMRSYALVRYALIAMYRHDATATVDLARQAQAGTASPRVRFLGAQREAQGHALAGDYDACMRSLDRARDLAPAGLAPTRTVLGSSQVADPVATATGWCLFDLGRPDQAAAHLRDELDRIGPSALRARARYGARLALALAGGGQPDAACDALDPVLDAYPAIRSATIRNDLRRLSMELNRWHRDPRVQDARLRLTAALYEPAVRQSTA